jgi:hypothetical protein
MGGRIIYQRYYGYQDLEALTPVTEDTYFRVASVTKLVSAIGLMQLRRRGSWDLDADITAISAMRLPCLFLRYAPYAAPADEPYRGAESNGFYETAQPCAPCSPKGEALRELFKPGPRKRLRILQFRRGNRGRCQGSGHGREREPLYTDTYSPRSPSTRPTILPYWMTRHAFPPYT